MGEILKKLIENHLGALLLIIIVLMIGQNGVNRILDRIVPQPSTAGVTRVVDELNALEERSRKLDTMIENQGQLMRSLRSVSERLEAGKIERAEIIKRLEEIEAWQEFVEEGREIMRPFRPELPR